MGDYADEQGEHFRQDVRFFEEQHKRYYFMMADYTWNLLRKSELTYDRQSRKIVLLITLSYKF